MSRTLVWSRTVGGDPAIVIFGLLMLIPGTLGTLAIPFMWMSPSALRDGIAMPLLMTAIFLVFFAAGMGAVFHRSGVEVDGERKLVRRWNRLIVELRRVEHPLALFNQVTLVNHKYFRAGGKYSGNVDFWVVSLEGPGRVCPLAAPVLTRSEAKAAADSVSAVALLPVAESRITTAPRGSDPREQF